MIERQPHYIFDKQFFDFIMEQIDTVDAVAIEKYLNGLSLEKQKIFVAMPDDRQQHITVLAQLTFDDYNKLVIACRAQQYTPGLHELNNIVTVARLFRPHEEELC